MRMWRKCWISSKPKSIHLRSQSHRYLYITLLTTRRPILSSMSVFWRYKRMRKTCTEKISQEIFIDKKRKLTETIHWRNVLFFITEDPKGTTPTSSQTSHRQRHLLSSKWCRDSNDKEHVTGRHFLMWSAGEKSTTWGAYHNQAWKCQARHWIRQASDWWGQTVY